MKQEALPLEIPVEIPVAIPVTHYRNVEPVVQQNNIRVIKIKPCKIDLEKDELEKCLSEIGIL